MGNNVSSDSSSDRTSEDESKSDKLSPTLVEQEMRCSLCLGIPKTEIYQCNIGHIICSSCSKNTDGCLICKNENVKGDLMRNHLAEKLSARLIIPCRFKDRGCKFTTPKLQMEEHENKCTYSGNILPFCRYLEYNCDYPSDCRRTQEMVDHFKTHEATIKSGDFVDLLFVKFSSSVGKCFEKLENGKFAHWKPVILQNSDGKSFLLLSRLFWLNKVKMLVLTCVQLDNEGDKNKYEVKVCVQTIHEKVRPITWKEMCLTFSDMKCAQTWSAFRICLVDELESLYTDHAGTMKIRVDLNRIENGLQNANTDTEETEASAFANNVVLCDLL